MNCHLMPSKTLYCDNMAVEYTRWWSTLGGVNLVVKYTCWWSTLGGGVHLVVEYTWWWSTLAGGVHSLVEYMSFVCMCHPKTSRDELTYSNYTS